MNLVLKIIAIIVLIASSVAAIMFQRGKRVLPICAAVVAILLFAFSCSFVIIPTGYTGVRITFGQIDDAVVQDGLNWKLPFVQSIKMVNNKQQDTEISGQVWSETSERTAIYYEDITLTYQINAEKSAWIYANVTDYKNSLITQAVVASAVKSSSKGLSDTDATNRAIIEPLVMDNLQASLNSKYGENTIIINKVTIGNADFDDSYNAAIAARQQAQINAEQQAIENQMAIDKAEAEAAVTKMEAQAAADAKIIEAQAEAEANELIEESLTDKILRQMYIERWNGELPDVVAGEDTSTIMIQPEGDE